MLLISVLCYLTTADALQSNPESALPVSYKIILNFAGKCSSVPPILLTDRHCVHYLYCIILYCVVFCV